jgi:uncharacterized membrane protein
MNVLLRVLRLLSMVVWVGGLIFFAFVLAPVAFSVLPSTHDAGTVVGATLRVLNMMAPYCGFVFILATLAEQYRQAPRRRLLTTQMLLVWLMLGATQYVRTSIVPAMERDRIAAGGDVDAAPPNNPARLDFERLHPISEKIEGAALLFGLGVVVMMGFEETTGRTAPPAYLTR